MKKNMLLLILIISSLAIFVAGCGSENDQVEVVEDNEIEEVEDEGVVEEEVEDVEDVHDHDHDQERDDGMAPDLIYEEADGSQAHLKNLAGEEVSLEDYRGKVIFLNFWATWCQYCNQQMPDVQRVHEEHDDVVVIGVDVGEDQAKVEEYLQEGGYTFEVALDLTGEVSQNYHVAGLPTTYTIREDGTISRYFSGMLTYEQMEDMLEIARTGE